MAPDPAPSTYEDAGVDTDKGYEFQERLIGRIRTTWDSSVRLDANHFATVIDVGGMGFAMCTDGVGTKALIAQMMGKYDTIGIDCVAMNVNDLVCVGARPISMLDYIALEEADPDVGEAIGEGLRRGAELAGISISGGETAQLRDVIKGHNGAGFDLVGMAIGSVDLDKILLGRDIAHGDIVIGLESNGIHANGIALARNIFFDRARFSVGTSLRGLDKPLGEELLKPTYIYVREALEVIEKVKSLRALIHITSGGLLNLNRVAADMGYVIDALPAPPPIFDLIQEHGEVAPEEMFRVFNMGIGFCVVVAPQDADAAIAIAAAHDHPAVKIGSVDASIPGQVRLPQFGLIGEGKGFRAAAA